MPRPRLILFSGMGADARLLDPQRQLGAEIIVPPWIPAEPGESLGSYARRMLPFVDVSKPFYLGGASLGGMIAQELAPLVGPNLQGLILLVSCTSNRGVPPLFRFLGRLISVFPAFMLRIGKSVVPAVRKLFGISTKQQAKLFQDMLADADPQFLKWSLGAVLKWKGPAARADVPTLNIAAEHDLILPCRYNTADYVVPNAGHTVNVTHAAEVNQIMAEWLSDRANASQASYNQPYGEKKIQIR